MTINLPEAEGKPQLTKNEDLEVVINKAGEYTINSQVLINTQIGTLKIALEKESHGDSSQPLIITADANTPHQSVVRVMDAAGQLGERMFLYGLKVEAFAMNFDRAAIHSIEHAIELDIHAAAFLQLS